MRSRLDSTEIRFGDYQLKCDEILCHSKQDLQFQSPNLRGKLAKLLHMDP